MASLTLAWLLASLLNQIQYSEYLAKFSRLAVQRRVTPRSRLNSLRLVDAPQAACGFELSAQPNAARVLPMASNLADSVSGGGLSASLF